MQGLPGSRSSGLSSAVPDHHLRMLDMAAYSGQGLNAEAALMMDQYGNGFNAAAAAALYSPQFAAVAGGLANGPRLNQEHHLQAGFMNGMIKLEALEGGGTGEQSAVTNATSASGEVSGYSSSPGGRETAAGDGGSQQSGGMNMAGNALAVKTKAKRRLPGMPDPDAEVVALSPRTLLATNRFVCEICSKGFQRDQNLQLHRRGHNLPWKLKQRGAKEVRKKVYVCPEASCVHHDPARALGDLTGIKKHFSRKHGEKKWKCDKCSKRYAVQSDWKAHSKTCGTREYRCDCGTLFSRRDSFVTHRAFCEALSEQSQIVGGHLAAGQHGHLSPATAAQLAAAGGPAAFGSLFGGAAISSKLDHIPPFNSPIVDHSAFSASSSAGRAGNRLPLWLSAAAAGGGHHPLLGANPNLNNIPLPPSLSSLQASPASVPIFLSSPTMAPPASAAGSGSGMLFGNPNSDLLAGDGSFGGLCSFNGLASISNSVYGAQQPHASSAPQISATSLLQKATQMGSSVNTADSLSFFKGSFASSMAPVSSTDAMYWPSSPSMRSSHGLPRINGNHALSGRQLPPAITGFHGDKTSPAIDPEPRFRSSILHNMDHATAVQEMVASFNSGGASMAPSSAASLFMRGGEHFDSVIPRSKAATQLLGADLSHPIMPASESPAASMIQAQQTLQQQMGSLTPVLNRPPSKQIKMEDASAAADNFTRDFLGVRGDNSLMESLDKSLFQRELGLTYSFNHSKDLSSEGENMSVQSSYPKPWEGPQ